MTIATPNSPYSYGGIVALSDVDVIEPASGFIDVNTLSTLGAVPGVSAPRFLTTNWQWVPNIPPTLHDVIRPYPGAPKLVRLVISELNKLIRLPKNWDSYAGRPVSLQAANHAASWMSNVCQLGMPMPHIVPGADSTVQLEWHEYDLDIEVLFYPSGDIEFAVSDLSTGNATDGSLPIDKQTLRNFMAILTQRAVGPSDGLGTWLY
ncbi:MAG: hypothetical protein IH985_04650 [Planctomycetes bacterium]|nr:hypothetical protein [Planctomycetota bacterium]